MRFVSGTVGRMADLGQLRRSVYLRMDGRWITLDAFTETGAGLASLSWETVEQDSLSATLGASWAWLFDLRERGRLSTYLRFEWSHEFQAMGEQGVRYADWTSSPVYLVRMDGWSRNRASVNFGAEWSLTDRLAVGAGYRGQVGTRSRSHGAELSFRWTW
jgi:outer membrane autotransporter protein